MKKTVLALAVLSIVIIPYCYAGEWSKKPFKDVYGNEQYQYKEDNYQATLSKKPFKNVYGKDEYQYEDNQGNKKTIRQKPFKDVYGNPVYEDVSQ